MDYGRSKGDPTVSNNETAVATVSDAAHQLIVICPEDVEIAADAVRSLKALAKEIKDHHEPIKKAAHAAWKATIAAEKKLLAPIESSTVHVRGLMANYEMEQERARRAAKKEAEEAARKEAEELQVPVDIVPVATVAEEKTEGVSYVTKYEWEFTGNLSEVHPSFLTLDSKAVTAIVNARGKDAEKIVGGVRVTERKVPRIR